MAKRIFATIILCATSCCGFAAHGAPAPQPPGSVDGCAVLGELVVTELALSRWFGKGSSGLLLEDAAATDIIICNQTARAVTGAFTAALAGMNIDVSWGYYPPHTGDTCLSGDLSQCYPDRYPLSAGTAGSRSFVVDGWRAVQSAVIASMPLGTASDTSRFSARGFSTTLSRSLEQKTSGPALDYQQNILSSEH